MAGPPVGGARGGGGGYRVTIGPRAFIRESLTLGLLAVDVFSLQDV
jgi:hypothetical protein